MRITGFLQDSRVPDKVGLLHGLGVSAPDLQVYPFIP